ncbi:hypothetical protein OROMI_016045 [Orobanche minor]
MAEGRKFTLTHTHTSAALDRDERRSGPNFMWRLGRSGDFRCGRRDGGDSEPMRMRAPIQVSGAAVFAGSGPRVLSAFDVKMGSRPWVHGAGLKYESRIDMNLKLRVKNWRIELSLTEKETGGLLELHRLNDDDDGRSYILGLHSDET